MGNQTSNDQQQTRTPSVIEHVNPITMEDIRRRSSAFRGPNQNNTQTTQPNELQLRNRNRSYSLTPKMFHRSATAAPEHRNKGVNTLNHACENQTNQLLYDPELCYKKFFSQKLQNPNAHASELEKYAELVKKLRLSRRDSSTAENLNNEDGKLCPITGLTPHRTLVIQKIWERTSETELIDCTRNIMAHLLRSSIQMYHFFDLLGMSDKEVLNCEKIHRQSANFAIVLDWVISNLNGEIEKVCVVLQLLGASHLEFLSYPIAAHHWALFTRVFEDKYDRATGVSVPIAKDHITLKANQYKNICISPSQKRKEKFNENADENDPNKL